MSYQMFVLILIMSIIQYSVSHSLWHIMYDIHTIIILQYDVMHCLVLQSVSGVHKNTSRPPSTGENKKNVMGPQTLGYQVIAKGKPYP